jgi:GNAT superfamily N-acetyltransferase
MECAVSDDWTNFRSEPRSSDVEAVRRIVSSTGFFYGHEVAVAVELVEERLSKGEASGYWFIFADDAAGRTVGYACYGPVPCTVGSYDLYWIAVEEGQRGGGVGRRLMAEVELRTGAAGGRRIYIETSSRPLYAPTRGFYERCGYVEEARLAEFYGEGDDKIVYSKALHPAT